MKLLHESNGKEKKDQLRSVILSIAFHAFILLCILFFPTFGNSEKIFIPSMDVTLYDLPPGNLGSAAGKTSEPESKPEEKKPAPKPEEKKPEPKSKDLMDPSEEELAKMKKRKDDWTPSAKKNSQSSADKLDASFPLGKQGVPGGRSSGSMSLDTTQFPYMYYLIMMKNKIGENWIPAFGAMKPNDMKRTVIAFKVDRSGVILEAKVEETSGDQELDRSALRAVTVSSPFPPLPEGFPDSILGVHFGFKYEM